MNYNNYILKFKYWYYIAVITIVLLALAAMILNINRPVQTDPLSLNIRFAVIVSLVTITFLTVYFLAKNSYNRDYQNVKELNEKMLFYQKYYRIYLISSTLAAVAPIISNLFSGDSVYMIFSVPGVVLLFQNYPATRRVAENLNLEEKEIARLESQFDNNQVLY